MIEVVRDGAGSPGHCCVCGRRWPRDCLCLPCRREHTDPSGQLVPWVAALHREAKRLARRAAFARPHRAAGAAAGRLLPGVVLLSLDQLLATLDDDEYAWGDHGRARQLLAYVASHSQGVDAPASEAGPGDRRAPALATWVAGHQGDVVTALRRYTASGVPLDMVDFLGLLRELGWPPPGTHADRRHREDVVDLYERVYPA